MTAPLDVRPPVRVRRFVAALFVLLLVPGLIGFELWPLTAWRLFSLASSDTQIRWGIEAMAADGSVRTVGLDELPIAFRHVAWGADYSYTGPASKRPSGPLASLSRASEDRRDEVCMALLSSVRARYPDTTGLRIVRDHQRMVYDDAEWTVVHDRQPFHSCGAPP